MSGQKLEGQTLVNRYRIETLLGEGGMARVYRAWDPLRSTRVAIKMIRDDLAGEPDFVERFRSEAAHLKRLSHDNIVPFYDFASEAGLAFIVMGLVDGPTLRQRLNQTNRLPLAEAAGIARDVAAALHYAHGQDVLHRDVKPANILLSRGKAFLSDFGVAHHARLATTVPGRAVGTAAYMSPEQCEGLPLDPRSDVYALGVVTYEMLVGRRPFAGDAEEVKWQHVHAPPPPLRRLDPAIPPAVEEVAVRALAKSPADRFGSALAFSQALAGALAGPAAARPPSPTPVSPAPRLAASGRPRAAIVVVSLAAVAVIAAAIALVGNRPNSAPTPRATGSFAVCVQPTSGDRTTQFTVSVGGLAANDTGTVNLRAFAPGTILDFETLVYLRPGVLVPVDCGSTPARPYGIQQTWTFEPGDPPGTWTIVARMADTGEENSASVTLLP